MLIRDTDIGGRRVDVRLRDGRVVEIGPTLTQETGAPRFDAAGGALLPGLHDHHLHLHALAASLASLDCGPPKVTTADDFARLLAEAAPQDGWIRGIGYFESVAGALDRKRLDGFRDDVPVRIQHRSGVLWFLNSRALEALRLEGRAEANDAPAHADIERDAGGRATGRLFRQDAWLRTRTATSAPPDLTEVGRRLAAVGITQVTDCTPSNGPEEAARFGAARQRGTLPQKVELMGGLPLGRNGPLREPGVTLGAHKILLDEPALPDFDGLVRSIEQAHAQDRGVAFHVVTRTELFFALAALDATGGHPGDRLEHASVSPNESLDAIRARGLRIVTQPHFVFERGDDYLRDVDPRDQPGLYRIASWLERGVPLRFGSDAPFGAPDPWASLDAAVARRTRSGRPLGPDEAVSPEAALAGFAPADRARDASRATRAVEVGDPADLCLLDRPWAIARAALRDTRVVATWIDGQQVHGTDPVAP